MEISKLLQIDATIIAGMVILLTMSSLKPEPNPKRSFLYFSKEQLHSCSNSFWGICNTIAC